MKIKKVFVLLLSHIYPPFSGSILLTPHKIGLLSPLLDPIGQGLHNVLSPLGNLIGGIGDGMAAYTTRDQEGKENRGDGAYEKFGGKEQNGGNPLGL